MNQISKWIWAAAEQKDDSYCEFVQNFDYNGNSAELLISVDSNYVVFLNGEFIESDQYPDFPHYKVYDRINITEHCKNGNNELRILVWYYGVSNMSYYPGNAACRFELYVDGKIECFSSDKTLSRISSAYKNGMCRNITVQLGFSYCYIANAAKDTQSGFAPSRIVDQNLPMFERPVEKLKVLPQVTAKHLGKGCEGELFDLGCEQVGYLTFEIESPVAQSLSVSYGEHIVDGGVRRVIHGRNFSFDFEIESGKTVYTNYFRRLGCRYLEIICDTPVNVKSIGILPSNYPVTKVEREFSNPLRKKIYDVSARTLELCMHDHYEDCPWREQGLYAMDSRNQMLCGYYAFNEFKFPRANLLLMSYDNRDDGILSICTPSKNNTTIPSFSLHWFIEIYEYTKYSGDITLIQEIMPKMQSVMNAFLCRMNNGLVPNFESEGSWNFYEWSYDLDGKKAKNDAKIYEAALNCLLSIALVKLQKMCDMLNIPAEYEKVSYEINKRIFEVFYDSDIGLFINGTDGKKYSELVNSLAILCGAAGSQAKSIAEKLTSINDMTPATLSMICFKFDALLHVDADGYRDYILNEIDKKYKLMLDAGATSFWETEKGERDFNNAGSLCHGWSAIPAYYYCILNA